MSSSDRNYNHEYIQFETRNYIIRIASGTFQPKCFL